jgi:hypothetical protein
MLFSNLKKSLERWKRALILYLKTILQGGFSTKEAQSLKDFQRRKKDLLDREEA